MRGVVVFRAVGEEGKFVQKSRLVQGASYADGEVAQGKIYRYRLRAYDTSGNFSDFSVPVTVMAKGSEDR
jgi:hypothetical protein